MMNTTRTHRQVEKLLRFSPALSIARHDDTKILMPKSPFLRFLATIALCLAAVGMNGCTPLQVSPDNIDWEKIDDIWLEIGDESYGVQLKTEGCPVTHIMRDSGSGIPLYNDPNGNLDRQEMEQLDTLLSNFLRVAPPMWVDEQNPFARVSTQYVDIGGMRGKDRVIRTQYNATDAATHEDFHKLWEFLKNQK